MKISEIEPSIIDILLPASELALDFFDNYKTLNLLKKSDLSPVTEADLAINDLILKELKSLTPEVPILSEELFSKKSLNKNQDYFWLVDPLDGTKEFINGSKHFSINIALINNGTPVLGAISEPAQHKIYIGSKNKPARLFSNDVFQNLKPKSATNDCMVSASKNHFSNRDKSFFNSLKKEYESIKMIEKGSSLKFCDLSDGSSDFYPRFGPVYQWDLAAGQAIIESLGGAILFMEAKDSYYSFDFEKKINGFIALARKENMQKISKIASFL